MKITELKRKIEVNLYYLESLKLQLQLAELQKKIKEFANFLNGNDIVDDDRTQAVIGVMFKEKFNLKNKE